MLGLYTSPASLMRLREEQMQNGLRYIAMYCVFLSPQNPGFYKAQGAAPAISNKNYSAIFPLSANQLDLEGDISLLFDCPCKVIRGNWRTGGGWMEPHVRKIGTRRCWLPVVLEGCARTSVCCLFRSQYPETLYHLPASLRLRWDMPFICSPVFSHR